MNTLAKALIGTTAAGAMAVSAASPAMARDRDGGISAGEVIAGALIIGGIAAVAASASRNNNAHYASDYRYDRAGYGGRHGFAVNPRQAVEMCVNAAHRNAARYTYGRAEVTDIRSVRDRRDGYEIKGRIAVQSQRGLGQGTGWNGDYRGYRSNLRGYDSGNFTCDIRNGRVANVKYSGIRALR